MNFLYMHATKVAGGKGEEGWRVEAWGRGFKEYA